jgi:WD40 repeat protein
LEGPELNVGSTNVAADWSRDEQTIAVITFDSVIGFYDATTGQKVGEGSLDQQPSHCDSAVLKISPDGRWIAGTTDVASHINLWNVSTGTVDGQLCGHCGMVRTMQFSPDSHQFYTGSDDGSVREWSLETFSQVRIID